MKKQNEPMSQHEMAMAVLGVIKDQDLISAMGVLCNVLGQILAANSNGAPGLIQQGGNEIAENVKKAAINTIMKQDEARRKADREEKDAG